MSDHLPECPAPQIAQAGHAVLSHASCICDLLRACEARVLQEAPVSVFAKAFHEGQAVGFDKGVQAARDAVAAEHESASVDYSAGYLLGMKDALAAIDALKGEPNG